MPLKEIQSKKEKLENFQLRINTVPLLGLKK